MHVEAISNNHFRFFFTTEDLRNITGDVTVEINDIDVENVDSILAYIIAEHDLDINKYSIKILERTIVLDIFISDYSNESMNSTTNACLTTDNIENLYLFLGSGYCNGELYHSKGKYYFIPEKKIPKYIAEEYLLELKFIVNSKLKDEFKLISTNATKDLLNEKEINL